VSAEIIHLRPTIAPESAVNGARLWAEDMKSVAIYAILKNGERVIWASGDQKSRNSLVQALNKTCPKF
jgi:hypothetical protein